MPALGMERYRDPVVSPFVCPGVNICDHLRRPYCSSLKSLKLFEIFTQNLVQI